MSQLNTYFLCSLSLSPLQLQLDPLFTRGEHSDFSTQSHSVCQTVNQRKTENFTQKYAS